MHFNNHANISASIWKELFPNDLIVHNLIKNDMLIHSSTACEIDELIKKDLQLVVNLCYSAFAELESNAGMFGGKQSISYKIKRKKICQRIRQVYNFVKKNP